ALGSGNVDHFGDFGSVDDTIRLDHKILAALGQTSGILSAGAFKVFGTGGPVDAAAGIFTNQKTGAVYYDADGSGAGVAIKFAIADNFAGDIPTMTHNDFLVV